jgi:hypothetical protein
VVFGPLGVEARALRLLATVLARVVFPWGVC